MVSVFALSTVDRGFGTRLGQTKDYKTGMCCFSNKYVSLWSTGKYRLARNQDNVSEWSDMFTRGLDSVSLPYKNPTQRVGLEESGHHHNFNWCNLFSPWYSWKIAHLALNNNHSLTLVFNKCNLKSGQQLCLYTLKI